MKIADSGHRSHNPDSRSKRQSFSTSACCVDARQAKHLLFYRNVSSPRRKNKSLCENRKQPYIPSHPAPATEGVSRSLRHVARDAMDAQLPQSGRRMRVRSSRVVLIPRRWDQANGNAISALRPKRRHSRQRLASPVLWGERGVSRKAIAQGVPDVSACLSNLWAFFPFCPRG